jgi:iron complex outermembrane receptor protein
MFQRSKIGSGVLLALGTLLAATAHAQDGDVQRVEVTGSAIKRINVEGALPIQTINQDQIKKSGVTSVTDLIQGLPAMQGFTTSSQSVNGGGGGITNANIHGIGDQYTLVLVNGHRFASYGTGSQVNLNQIPLSIIDHVDVLTDGASALYGADAIAGVVNIVTKRDTTAGAIDVSLDHPFKKGGKSASASISKGFGNLDTDRYNVFLAASFDHTQAIEAKDRSYSKTGILSWTDGKGSHTVNLASAYSIGANVDAETSDGGELYYNPALASNGSCTAANTVKSGDVCKYDYAATVQDTPATRRAGFMATGRFQLNDKVQLWAETVFGSARTDARYAAGAQVFDMTASQIATYVTPQLADGVTSSSEQAYVRLVGTGGRKDGYQTNTQHFVVGADVTTGNWDSSFSLTHSQNHYYDIAEGGYADANKVQDLIDKGTYDPFSADPQTDALASTVLHQTLDQTRSTLDVASARTSTALTHLPGGDMQLATGIDLSRQKYTDRPSAIVQGANTLQADYTDSVFGGTSGSLPFDSSRNAWGVFAEVSAPVTKQLELGASARFDSYGAVHNKDGFDASGDFTGTQTQGKKNSATTFKLDAAFRPTKELLLRASLGTGFKVPTIGDISNPLQEYGVTGNQVCTNAPAELEAYCHDGESREWNELSGGNSASDATALRPEKSTQWTLGFRVEPSPAFSFGADLWTVRIRDQIGAITETTAFSDMSKYSYLFTVQPVAGSGSTVDVLHFISQPLNMGTAFYQGIDLDAESHIATPVGRLTTRGHLTWMLHADYQQPGDSGYYNSLSKVGVDGQVMFRYQINANTSLEQGKFTHTVGFNFKPGYADDTSKYAAGRRVSSYALFDFQEKYDVTKAFSVTAGIKNVFDRNPPFSLNNQSATGNARGYDGRYTNPEGRTFAASASYKF